MWNCNSEFESRALPQELIVALMLYPIANSIIFKNLPAKHVAISWGLSLAVISLFIGFTGLTQSLPALVFYTPFSAGFLLENHRQDLILFHVVKSQKKLLLENQQMSDEMATELRHMIANVAHDLKTVLILSLFLPNLFILICSLIAASVRVHERH
jgi:signal transduction histidine kinase